MDGTDNTRRLDRLCDQFRTTLKLRHLATALAMLIVLALLLAAGFAALDWWRHMGWAVRLILLLIYLTAVGSAVWLALIQPLTRRWSNRQVLSYLDASSPAGQDMLMDLYELSGAQEQIQELQTPQGRQLAEQALDDLAPLAEQVRPSGSFVARTTGRWLLAAGVVLVAALGFTARYPAHTQAGLVRLFNPFSSHRWPHRTAIVVYRADPTTGGPMLDPRTGEKMRITPEGVSVPELEKLPLVAEVTDVAGAPPIEVTLFWKGASGREWIPRPLPVRDGLVRYEFPEVGEPLTFYIQGGDYETDRLPIYIIERPYVKRIAVDYDYPDYAGIPDRRGVPGGGIYGLQGTRVNMTIEVSMPVDEAVFVLQENPPTDSLPAAREKSYRMKTVAGSDTTYGMSLRLRYDGRYSVQLTKDGYSQARREAHSIRVVEDRLPRIDIVSPGRDLVETRLASIEMAFNASDDYGLQRVEVVYKAEGDRKAERPAEEKVLDDKITGPIDPQQTGRPTKQVPARFKWQLRKMADLPDSGTLTYFVRVLDIYPSADREVITSPDFEIKLVRPSEFQREAFERAKGLLAEALIAWDSQLAAYEWGLKWLAEGSGKEDDALWTELTDKQRRAFVAARAMQHHLRVLDEKYTRNNMQQDFMAGRLAVIADLLNELTSTHQLRIDQALRRARPRTSAEALPEQRKVLRRTALEAKGADNWSARDHQKMSVLLLERLLRKVLDWFDLQTCIITTKLMYEQQEEVLARTQAIAGEYIGKSILDLTDKQQEELITLGKQQKAVFDTETGLERQIAFLIERAERQARRAIRDPLMAAFSVLRNKRVNDNLKKAYMMIANNQPSQIVRQQKDALAALKVVETGLIVAGQNVEADPALDLAMNIAGRDVFQPPRPRVAATGPTTTGPVATGTLEPLPPAPIGPDVLPEPETTLAELVRKAAELEDSVRGRSVYLFQNGDPKVEMPRFIRLKLRRLAEWQQTAGEQIVESIGKARTDGSRPVRDVLASVRAEFGQSAELIAAKDVSATAQQLQADAVISLNDVLQLMALEAVVKDAAAENRRQGGVDPFQRKYLLRDEQADEAKGTKKREDLRLAEETVADLNEARMLQRDVLRKVRRFQGQPAGGKTAARVEALNRKRAAQAQNRAASLLEDAAGHVRKLSDEVRPAVLGAGVDALLQAKPVFAAYARRIAAGNEDEALVEEVGGRAADPEKGTPRVAGTIDLLGAAVQNMRDLLEARVKPPTVVKAPPRQMTPEEWARRTSPEHLQELLAKDKTLAPEIRQRMIQALAHKDKFPPKYRELIAAYYASFVAEQEEALQKDKDKQPGGE